MSKNYWKEKWRKRLALGAVAALSLSLALGTLSACKSGDDNNDDDDDNTTTSRTDTQLIKNGDFEFYSEMDKDLADKRAFINSPNSWSFTSGSPSSNTTSGIININQKEWDSYTKSTHRLVPAEGTADADKPSDANAISEAIAHWEEASVYDRLQFFDEYDDAIDDLASSSEEKKFFNKYSYSIDFEDVEKLREELGDTVKTHDESEENSSVLMIHNQRTTDNVRGTGQYYTSSTTITLKPGTAAKVSVWVKTCELYHFYAENGEEKEPTPVTRDSLEGGAYIGITNTVGSSTLDQVQIKNIRSPHEGDADYAHNGWVQYTAFVRGSTFADSTFKIVLGLGQSTSSNRYEAVDGYALFDDLECTVMTANKYETEAATAAVEFGSKNVNYCALDYAKEEKIFDTAKSDANGKNSKGKTAFALDLYASEQRRPLTLDTAEPNTKTAVTTEFSGTKPYDSKIPSNIGDPAVDKDKQSLAGVYSYSALEALTQAGADYNGYLANFFAKDFKDAFPFDGDDAASKQVVLLMSTNGAAYTTEINRVALPAGGENPFLVEKNSYKLLSFFVKTNVRTGAAGASATLVDEGGNETKISAFDSTSIAKTDIENNTQEAEDYNKKDIYNGWVQCFFFIENPTDVDQTFRLKLHYGVTSIASSKTSDYVDGYAAFTAFETQNLTASQYGYVSTGSQAVKVTLSDKAKDTSSFDTASRTSDIEKGFATPASFNGVISTNIRIDPSDTATTDNNPPEGVYTGLLNAEHAETYMNYTTEGTDEQKAWSGALSDLAGAAADGREWWNNIFGDASLYGRVSNQPLVILNTKNEDVTSYGYYLYNTATVSADSYQKISMRVKLSKDATAFIYLNDASDIKNGYGNALTPSVAQITYWYDDDGNICAKDPSSKDFRKKTDILFYLETNGLYTKAGDTSKTYYANLHNYETDEDGNLVTSDDKTIAYYCRKENDKNVYYAYYDKDTDTYSQVVENLPVVDDENNSIVRYTAPADLAKYGSVIKITGTDETEGKWIDVSFFIHTGNAQKTYRLEIWAGSRDNETKMKANSYFFFDSYSSSDASSNYQTLLDEKIQNVKNKENTGLNPGDEGYLGADDNLPATYALYSTFTFYDAPWYLRYDETTDTDDEGNPYSSYKQSSNSEKLVSFAYDNTNGAISEKELNSYACFLDYSAYDVTVERSTNNDTDDDHDHDDSTTNNDSNIWLILSSVLLVAALVVAAGAVIGRRVVRHLRKTGRLSSGKKPKKQKKQKPVVVEEAKEEPKKEDEKPLDPDDPYNE